MSATITRALKIDKAMENIADLDQGHYYFTGKPVSWDDPAAPDDVGNSNDDLRKCYDQMIFLKKCSSSDAILCIPRFNWETNTVYEKYKSNRNQRELSEFTRQSKSIYCMNSSGAVYLCLDNNGGVPSTIEPTNTNTSRFEETDGYIWKFLFVLTSTIESKFLSQHWIPVPYILSQKDILQQNVEAAAVPGTIDSITIVNGGSEYDSDITINIIGDGVNATATPTVVDGEITDIHMSNVGSGYNNAEITIVGDGSGAEFEIEISPMFGHGHDIKSDLNANFIMFYGQFEVDEDGVYPTVNEFGQLGIIKNPTDDSDVVLTGDKYGVYTTLSLTNISSGPYDFDEIVTGNTSNTTGIVFDRPDAGATAGDILLVGVNNPFTVSEQLSSEGDAIATISSITLSTYKKFSGKILYLENIKSVSRRVSQTESFRFIIEY